MKDKLSLAPIWMWKQILEADDEGNIYWLLDTGKKGDKIHQISRSVGSPNGVPQFYKVCYIYINNKCIQFAVHRLLWLLWYNEIPDTIDHINGIKHDNRKVNLRNVTSIENNKNVIKGSRWVRKIKIEQTHKSYAKKA